MEDNNKEKMFRKIQEALQNIPDNFSILEEQVDLDLQMKYFKFSKKVKEGLDEENILTHINDLFNPDIEKEEKKRLMVSLASIDSIEALRALEKYVKEADESLDKWAILAYQESRMLIETSLLGEQQMFISTGLGGKGNLLRYFAVIIGKNEREFSNTEKKLITDELEFALGHHESILEEIDFHQGYVSTLTMIPIRQPIKEIFDSTIQECNQLGDFLFDEVILTNVKIFNDQEITDMITAKRHNQTDTSEDEAGDEN